MAGKAEIHRMWAGSDRNKDIVKAGLSKSNKDTGEGINWDDYDEQKAAHTNAEWGLTGTAAWTAAHVKAWREEQMAAGSKKRGGAYALLPSSRSPEHAMEWLRGQRTLGILRPSPLVGVQPWLQSQMVGGRRVQVLAIEWYTDVSVVLEARAFTCGDAAIQARQGFYWC